MHSTAKTPNEYLRSLSNDRRDAISLVRKLILRNLPAGYKEVMQYGMISYVVPLKLFRRGYLDDGKTPLPYASLASQKNHMALYLMCAYGNEKINRQFREDYKKSGKKLDMGKSCVRFKKIDNLALDAIAHVIAAVPVKKFIAAYEQARTKR